MHFRERKVRWQYSPLSVGRERERERIISQLCPPPLQSTLTNTPYSVHCTALYSTLLCCSALLRLIHQEMKWGSGNLTPISSPETAGWQVGPRCLSGSSAPAIRPIGKPLAREALAILITVAFHQSAEYSVLWYSIQSRTVMGLDFRALGASCRGFCAAGTRMFVSRVSYSLVKRRKRQQREILRPPSLSSLLPPFSSWSIFCLSSLEIN